MKNCATARVLNQNGNCQHHECIFYLILCAGRLKNSNCIKVNNIVPVSTNTKRILQDLKYFICHSNSLLRGVQGVAFSNFRRFFLQFPFFCQFFALFPNFQNFKCNFQGNIRASKIIIYAFAIGSTSISISDCRWFLNDFRFSYHFFAISVC